jgi:long-chain acyl-CoA synthetase
VPQFLTAYFGALTAGMVVLPINPLLKAPEIEHQLSDSGASIMLGLAGLHAEAAKACELADVPLYLAGDPPPGVDARSLGELMDALPARSPGEHMSTGLLAEPGGEIWPGNADDTAVLIYTSGTTGKPKCAELSHFLLYMNCTVSGQLFGARPDDVPLAVLPFFHVFGLSSVINVSVRCSTSSSTGLRTWSSGAATTSIRARSKRFCTPSRASRRPRSSASLTSGSAKT